MAKPTEPAADRGRGAAAHAPGKRHRPPPPSGHGVKHSDEQIAKVKAAEVREARAMADAVRPTSGKPPRPDRPLDLPFVVTSPAFADGEAIPRRYTCDGANVSPALHWTRAPETAKAFALLLHDPDAPSGDFTHWLLTDIPAHETTLDEGAVGIGTAGANDFGRVGYAGPCPPHGHGVHRYLLRLYALRDFMRLPAPVTRDAFERALGPLKLDEAVLRGRYSRQ